MEMNSHSRFYAAPLRLHTYLCQRFMTGGENAATPSSRRMMIRYWQQLLVVSAAGCCRRAATLVCSGAALKRRRRLFAARVHVCGRVSGLMHIHVRNTIAELD